MLKLKNHLPSVFDITFAFNKFSLGTEFLTKTLGFDEDEINSYDFDVLSKLGFSKTEISSANDYVCGTMTIEGAPFLKHDHYSIFDCANKCGKKGNKIHSSNGTH